VSLLLGLAALVVIVLRAISATQPGRESSENSLLTGEAPTARPTDPTISVPVERQELPPLAAGTITTVLPSSPADHWANRLLTQALPYLESAPPSSAGMPWWQSQDLRGLLTTDTGRVQIDGRYLNLDQVQRLTIFTPDADTPRTDQLRQQAVVAWSGDALTLTAHADPPLLEANWLISSGNISTALWAFVTQASLREAVFLVAYNETLDREGQLALLAVTEPGLAGLSTLTAQPGLATLSDTPTPTLFLSPTPTREREPYMGSALTARLDPVIDAIPSFAPEAIARYTDTHPWTGVLAWTEIGPEVDGRPIAVSQAEILYFYSLQPDDPTGVASSFIEITYDGASTYLPDDRLVFFGHRMEEMVYWIVRRAGERNGQLVVAYDDFGTRQFITVIDFYSFVTPTP
jgi:hypothetical protein